MSTDKFHEWLLTEVGLKVKSARDVVSRYKRIEKITKVNLDNSLEDIIRELDNNPEFKKLSVYVKPQLKRALRLYKEFSKGAVHK